jgi:hypothetical protein
MLSLPLSVSLRWAKKFPAVCESLESVVLAGFFSWRIFRWLLGSSK